MFLRFFVTGLGFVSLFLQLVVIRAQLSDGTTRHSRSAIDDHKGWGPICSHGARQSPIDIKLSDAVVSEFSSFRFDPAYVQKQRFWAKNTGHTAQAGLHNPLVKPRIYGGGLKGEYIFEQLHFHWESEHEFDGKRSDLEMHMVHYNAKYPSMKKALDHSDGVVVLAVMFDVKANVTNDRKDFFSFVREEVLMQKSSEDHSLADHGFAKKDSFALRDLLPEKLDRFFRYDGSLTTPDCNEVVQWTVYISRLYVSPDTLAAFRSMRDDHGQRISQNNRPPQNLNGRRVYIQIPNLRYDHTSIGISTRSSVYVLSALSLLYLKLGL